MRKALKWTGIALGTLFVLLLILGFAMYMIGGSKLGKTYDLPDVALSVSDDSTTLARGAYLEGTLGCRDCHGEGLRGAEMFDAPPFRIVAPNLTPLGIGGQLSDADFERAIRHGIGRDGTSLVIMPSRAYHGLADEDVGALISYIRSIPAVENEPGTTRIKAMGRMIAAGPFDPAFEVNTEASPTSRPPVGPTSAYGGYLFGTFCHYCHGENGEGMETPPMPESPPAPTLAAAANWTLDQFKVALRTGVTPSGRVLSREFMLIDVTAHFSDQDLEALHTFLGTL